MEEFPVLLLGIAAFLLIAGVVGHDTEMGVTKFKFGIKGNIGPVPRVLLVIVSSVTFVISLGAWALIVADHEGPYVAPTVPTIPVTPVPVQAVNVTIAAALRPDLGEYAEQAVLLVDGIAVTDWMFDQANPSGSIEITTTPGAHSYSFTGTYAYIDQSQLPRTMPVSGSGSVVFQDGATYVVTYSVTSGRFSLEPANV